MKQKILSLLMTIVLTVSLFGTTASAAGNTTVSQYNTGKNTIETVLGCSRSSVLSWLAKHVNDKYYLTTPYGFGDYRNPNGDPAGYGSRDTPGVAAMNCTGFIWHVLRSAGGSNVPGMSGWVTLLEKNKIEYRTYINKSSVNDMISTILSDGYISPGDIIWTWDAQTTVSSTGLPHGTANYHHVGIYIGDYFDEFHTGDVNWQSTSNPKNRWWHSTDYAAASKGFSGNQTTNISPITSCNAITVIKLSNEKVSCCPDIANSSWYYDYVTDVINVGLMEGYDTGFWGPNDTLKRGQFATILYRMAGSPVTSYSNAFFDVPSNTYYSLPVTWASNEGLVLGYAAGDFKPNIPLSREQLATMMYRYAMWRGDTVTVSGDYHTFPDGYKVSAYAQEAMNWAIGKGIIEGDNNGYLFPQGTATRAECAAILYRYLGL